MEDLSVADVLGLAADLLTPEGAWTQGTSAEDADGNAVSVIDPDATCWCIAGVLTRLCAEPNDSMNRTLYRNTRRAFIDATGSDDIVDWNDEQGRTQAEVVAALRNAALKARAGEGSGE